MTDQTDTPTVQTDRIVLSDNPPRWVTRDDETLYLHREGVEVDVPMADADDLLTALEFLTDFHPRETRDTAPEVFEMEPQTDSNSGYSAIESTGRCPECGGSLVNEMGTEGKRCIACNYKE